MVGQRNNRMPDSMPHFINQIIFHGFLTTLTNIGYTVTVNDLYYKTGDDGVVRGYDMVSGELVSRSDNIDMYRRVPYTLEVAHKILELVRNGETISAISRVEGMPNPGVIYTWLQSHPDFKEAMEQARLDRAEVFHDKAIATAENVTDKDEVPAARLLVDTYKWAAEKGDKNRFGSSKIDIDVKQQDIIVMDTGIDRSKKYDEPIDGQFVELPKKEGDESCDMEAASEDAGLLEGDTVDAGTTDAEDDTVSEGSISARGEEDNKGSDQVGEG